MFRFGCRIAIAVLFLVVLRVDAQSPTGRNANLVMFAASGAEGSFRLSGKAQEWVETGADHNQIRFRYRETNRDDWSVYLHDASRRVDIQLDLHTKKVMYSDATNPQRRELAAITEAYAKTNGWLVKRVEFDAGSFAQSGNEWIERANGSQQPRFRFRETGRDDWSVYLRDESRQVDLQLDLHTGNIYYSDAKTPRQVLYRITRSS